VRCGCVGGFRRMSPPKHIARQLLRAATGGGANYTEARGAESRADFIHKLGIANQDVREALYWLQLTQEAEARSGRSARAITGIE
jgi:four helix bundle protein